ncbi:MAG TPA: hypothetical protein VIN61_17990 [Gammaproteobacteria bacterium]
MIRFVRLGWPVLVAAGAAAAPRPEEPVEGRHAVALEDLAWPAPPASALAVRPSPRCASVALPLTPATRYFVHGRAVDAETFPAAAEAARAASPEAVAFIYYELATGRVTRVIVAAPHPALASGHGAFEVRR